MIGLSQTPRVVAFIAAAGCVGAAVLLGSESVASTSHRLRPPAPTSASNRRAAVRDAERLLDLAPRSLPSSAVRLSAEPPGDDKLLVAPPKEPVRQIIDRYAWWRVPAAFDSVVAYVQAHHPPLPPGPYSVSGGGEGGPGVPKNQMFSYWFRPVGEVISMRALTFNAVALSGGGTGVFVDARETWVVPRAPSEQVPAGVHVVEVTSARPGMPAIASRTVTTAAKVRRIISLVDQMPIVQPGVTSSCPGLTGSHPDVTFDFRAAVGRPILAEARVTDYGGLSGPCNPVSFSIHGRRQDPLIGSDFLTRIHRLLGIRFQ